MDIQLKTNSSFQRAVLVVFLEVKNKLIEIERSKGEKNVQYFCCTNVHTTNLVNTLKSHLAANYLNYKIKLDFNIPFEDSLFFNSEEQLNFMQK